MRVCAEQLPSYKLRVRKEPFSVGYTDLTSIFEAFYSHSQICLRCPHLAVERAREVGKASENKAAGLAHVDKVSNHKHKEKKITPVLSEEDAQY